MSDFEAVESAPLPDEAAMSATSEAEQAEGEQTEAVTDEPVAEGTDGPVAPATDDPEPAEEEQKQTESKSARRRRQQRERAEKAEAEAAQLKARIEQLEARINPDSALKPEDFESYDAYLSASVSQTALAAFRKEEQSQLQADHKAASEQVEAARQEAVRGIFQDGTEKHADFEQTLRNPALPMTEEMVAVAVDADNPEDVLYHLGKNPLEAERLSRLSGPRLGLEIGKISAALRASKKQQVTSAPAPIKPVKGNSGTSEKDPAKMTMAEYRKWRNL